MSMNDQHIEKLFRTQAGSYKVDPSPGLWQKVHARILWKQFLTFNLQTFNVYYLAAVITLAGIGSYALLSGLKDTGQEPGLIPSQAAEMEYQAEPSQDPPETETEKSVVMEPVSPEQGTESSGLKSGEFVEEEEKEESIQTKPLTQKTDQGTQTGEAPETPAADLSARKSDPVRVTAGFKASQLSGCSPMAVQFENLSENAVQYSWTFGDGGSSSEKNPSYIFDESGDYPVILKILGADGLEYTAHQTISVFETPKALFEMDDEVELSSNQPVYFYNYSRGADYYEWDFGDQQYSNQSEPVHYYDIPGNYNIKLKVWTENQCYDSLIIMNAFTGQESWIRFPTAFTPNMTGPTGGYYDVNDLRNTIFHPVFSGDLIEYQLKIFNRHGLQIFESNDVAYGWDGYYQEQLGAQAVYIWKARGKFSNGKTFVKSGDVTLIRQY